MEPRIVFDNISCFYGEVLGVNRVHLSIPPGVTSLVGPNGSGKTTLMNLMSGLIRPTQGQIRVLGAQAGSGGGCPVGRRCASATEPGRRRRNGTVFAATAAPNAVPEPSTVVLSIVGGFGLAIGYSYRRRKF